jgi:hypothetical protein
MSILARAGKTCVGPRRRFFRAARDNALNADAFC